MLESVLRRLARDQWVRLHGTPRVTLLVGDRRWREVWDRWVELSGTAGTLLAVDGATGPAADALFDDRMRAAVARAIAEPAHPIAVLAPTDVATRWRAGRRDRLAAMADEGWLAVDEPPRDEHRGPERPDGRDRPEGPERPAQIDARSVAEAALFEALEATPATAGRFRLNASLSVRFGPAAAEVDLLSRDDRIAIEIDGFHHFTDPDRYRRDRRKDLLLQTHGFVVVRVLAEDVMRDARAAVSAVVQALAYRQAREESEA